jgi:hypothetical protein
MSVSTSNGRAARQGDQWRNIFSQNRTGGLESTKIIFPKSHFCFRRRCAFALSKRSAFAQIHTALLALIASAGNGHVHFQGIRQASDRGGETRGLRREMPLAAENDRGLPSDA